jgi:hypothetical protein
MRRVLLTVVAMVTEVLDVVFGLLHQDVQPFA